jgi:hypothetical protein
MQPTASTAMGMFTGYIPPSRIFLTPDIIQATSSPQTQQLGPRSLCRHSVLIKRNSSYAIYKRTPIGWPRRHIFRLQRPMPLINNGL